MNKVLETTLQKEEGKIRFFIVAAPEDKIARKAIRKELGAMGLGFDLVGSPHCDIEYEYEKEAAAKVGITGKFYVKHEYVNDN